MNILELHLSNDYVQYGLLCTVLLANICVAHIFRHLWNNKRWLAEPLLYPQYRDSFTSMLWCTVSCLPEKQSISQFTVVLLSALDTRTQSRTNVFWGSHIENLLLRVTYGIFLKTQIFFYLYVLLTMYICFVHLQL